MSSKLVYSCDQCSQEIAKWHNMKSLGMLSNSHGPSLAFGTWGEKESQIPSVLHFCDIRCAERYLGNWLRDQIQPAVDAEFTEVEPPPTAEKPPSLEPTSEDGKIEIPF